MIKVVVSGALGKMGLESCKAVANADGLLLVGAVDHQGIGDCIGPLIGRPDVDVTLSGNLEEVLLYQKPDVLIDFTRPGAVQGNIELALKHGVRPVVGTTGMSTQEIEHFTALAQSKKIGGLIAPNFAIGALLMMKFAAEAAKYFPNVEIIELHHDQKVDAPSGTALKTAEIITSVRGNRPQGMPSEFEKIQGVRGGNYEGMRIHSVRLPGLVAHQEVILGDIGQTLTIRHDSISRESFMPGLIMAVRKVVNLEHLVYGLENLLFQN
ncbi:4-hydroxy-tetrahydrodipicolinate reductase [Desulforamulus ruminis]|uniref:4-hydroxy-tetrahydrodipicolinate reductase n=1 Tax=Desulforamulus ruminis (strain ATCC 23193 / DSM 2154 / NCIMB 8452 / DL) TaxID=696281 RepID=F6DUN5_DESRL|nr:4-hydroxy-tetrahydrodipicolinate reductase [Desulforamulus ruminis]AEG60173.1 dihydrodipicolinate reductase [Desulforamulus ruminis DSM 2154]